MAPKSTTSKNKTANLGFESKLWLTADKLRNNLDTTGIEQSRRLKHSCKSQIEICKLPFRPVRWRKTVGRPEIQAFNRALASKHARKGIFITTSGYTTDARTYAQTVEGIVLIDGNRLAELMIDHEIGIRRKAVYVPKVDSDYLGE